MSKSKLGLVGLCFVVGANLAVATEGGGSVYPLGVENFSCCALPPPGLYGMVWGQSYAADKIRGNSGAVATASDFKVTSSAVVPRVVWVTPYAVADAALGFHAILPIVDLKVENAPPGSQHKTGIGDTTVGVALGWHKGANLHSVLGLDVYVPTGSFDKSDVVNIGRNYWAIQPLAGISYIDRDGLNADLKAMWTFNRRNAATDYQSGQEVIVDYALGWAVGANWTLGLGGYAYQQVSNDSRNGTTVADNKGRALAIGPSVRYDSGKGWLVTAKYQAESAVRNRADGGAFWVKAVLPF